MRIGFGTRILKQIAGIGMAIWVGTLGLRAEAQGKPGPVKVFILAGQSNMEGYGSISALDKDGNERPGTLVSIMKNPAKSSLIAPWKPNGKESGNTAISEPIRIGANNNNFGDTAPGVVKKLQVDYSVGGQKKSLTATEGQEVVIPVPNGPLVIEKALYGALPDGPKADVTAKVRILTTPGHTLPTWKTRDDVYVWFHARKGPLTVGYGAARDLFGPELGFGRLMGDTLNSPVLIIKTAWGGKSLYRDYRPPSSGPQPNPRPNEDPKEVGEYYRKLLETVQTVVHDIPTTFPALANRKVELAGLAWWQGWNDGVDPRRAIPEYEHNLVNLIHDLRRDLKSPNLPIVVGELTGPWVQAPKEWAELRAAQAAASDPARHPEFKGNVLFVPTHDFVRPENESPGGWPAHEFNNAETYYLVGDALGHGMLELLHTPSSPSSPAPLGSLSTQQPPAKQTASTTPTYTTRKMEGWTVRINDTLLLDTKLDTKPDTKAQTESAMALLQKQLVEITRIVPEPALSRLREVTIWVSPEYPNTVPRAEYHPGAEWLKENGRNPTMAKGVEISNVRIFDKECIRMPYFILHELAHSYHDRVLPRGFDNPEVRAAYERARDSKSYDRVERFFGNNRPNTFERAYAMTNPQEYFAESTEAFFGRNDFFPFNRKELEQHDPEMARLLQKLWYQKGTGNREEGTEKK